MALQPPSQAITRTDPPPVSTGSPQEHKAGFPQTGWTAPGSGRQETGPAACPPDRMWKQASEAIIGQRTMFSGVPRHRRRHPASSPRGPSATRPHSDSRSLTSPHPKLIFTTYKIDAHPALALLRDFPLADGLRPYSKGDTRGGGGDRMVSTYGG